MLWDGEREREREKERERERVGGSCSWRGCFFVTDSFKVVWATHHPRQIVSDLWGQMWPAADTVGCAHQSHPRLQQAFLETSRWPECTFQCVPLLWCAWHAESSACVLWSLTLYQGDVFARRLAQQKSVFEDAAWMTNKERETRIVKATSPVVGTVTRVILLEWMGNIHWRSEQGWG